MEKLEYACLRGQVFLCPISSTANTAQRASFVHVLYMWYMSPLNNFYIFWGVHVCGFIVLFLNDCVVLYFAVLLPVYVVWGYFLWYECGYPEGLSFIVTVFRGTSVPPDCLLYQYIPVIEGLFAGRYCPFKFACAQDLYHQAPWWSTAQLLRSRESRSLSLVEKGALTLYVNESTHEPASENKQTFHPLTSRVKPCVIQSFITLAWFYRQNSHVWPFIG